MFASQVRVDAAEKQIREALSAQKRWEPRLEAVETRSIRNETGLKGAATTADIFKISLAVFTTLGVIIAAATAAVAFVSSIGSGSEEAAALAGSQTENADAERPGAIEGTAAGGDAAEMANVQGTQEEMRDGEAAEIRAQ